VRVLGIDTATRFASVAVAVDGRGVVERTLPMSGSHGRTLFPLIEEVLAVADLGPDAVDLIAVSIGPGSFTGLRVGLSAAKGLALASNAALVGVPTLDAYALAAGRRAGTVWTVLDARKGEVYAAAFRWHCDAPEKVEPTMAVTPVALVGRMDAACTLVGDGVDSYAELWRSRLGPEATLIELATLPPSAYAVATCGVQLAARHGLAAADHLEPVYCRLPEAQAGRDQREALPERAEIDRG
jgi:tRNA threonylcarbamoyladenosine biosynthesis protein TsaB